MPDLRPMHDLPPPPPPDAPRDVWRAAIIALPPDAREAFADLFARPAIEASRSDARDMALTELVAERKGSAKALAEVVHRALTRYATSGWKFDHTSSQPREIRHRAAHAFLRNNGGKVPSINRLRIIIGQKKLITKAAFNDQLSARE